MVRALAGLSTTTTFFNAALTLLLLRAAPGSLICGGRGKWGWGPGSVNGGQAPAVAVSGFPPKGELFSGARGHSATEQLGAAGQRQFDERCEHLAGGRRRLAG